MEELIDSRLGKIRVIKLVQELRDHIHHLKWGRDADTKVDAALGGGSLRGMEVSQSTCHP